MNFTISKKIILFFILLSSFLTANFLGLDNLSFSNINWLYGGGDISNAQNGWLFFKSDEWRFPLGKNPSYGLEISSSIIFSDSVPLFAFILDNNKRVNSMGPNKLTLIIARKGIKEITLRKLRLIYIGRKCTI